MGYVQCSDLDDDDEVLALTFIVDYGYILSTMRVPPF